MTLLGKDKHLNLAFFARLPSELDKREDWNDQA